MRLKSFRKEWLRVWRAGAAGVAIFGWGWSAVAATLHVAPSGSHQPPFATWATAATNILPALEAATAGDMVLVTNGVYGLDKELGVPDGVSLQSVNGAEVTIIDGNQTNRCVHLKGNQALAEGFTIRHGAADFGAGVRFGVGGILRHCIVTQNTATNAGGAGVYVRWNGVVEHCQITGNQALQGQGGGICFLSGGSMRNSVISGNRARVGGGVGLLFHATMENCLVVSNIAAQAGGVICSQNSLVLNSTIAHNIATSAGGLHGFYGGLVRNSIIYENQAVRGANYTMLSSPDNQTRFEFSCTFPLLAGTGNIDSDPAWLNGAQGVFQLSAGSPCIDAGDNESAPFDDLLGNNRPQDGNNSGMAVVDMGAFEYAP